MSGIQRALKIKRNYIFLFLLLTAVYHSNFRPIPSGDTLGAALVPFSLLLDGSPALNRFAPYMLQEIQYGPHILRRAGGNWHSTYPIAGPVAATPLYLPALLVPQLGELPPATLIALARVAEKAVAALLATLTALVMLALLSRVTNSRSAFQLTLVFALGTANWSTNSQALWQHTYGSLAIAGCFFAIARLGAGRDSGPPSSTSAWLAGACAALAVAIRPTNIILIPALLLALWLSRTAWLHYVRAFVPIALAGAAVAAYNFAVFGRLAGGYAVHMDGDLLPGLAGILLSPGRGLIVFTPVVLFALAALAPAARAGLRNHLPLAAAAGLFVVLQILLIAKWRIWWGGYCWGPRLLTELLIPMMILIAIGLPALNTRPLRSAFTVAAAYCVLVQALGVYFYPKGYWDNAPVSVDRELGRLWNWADNPLLRTASGGFVWEPYAIVRATLTGGLKAGAAKIKELGIKTH